MNPAIDRFMSEHVPQFALALDRLDRQLDPGSEPLSESILEDVSQCISDSLQACRQFETELNGDGPVVLKEVQTRYREAIAPVLSKSWVWNRSTTKPRGYPGDYQLLTAIYNGEPKSTGFGGYVDRYLLNFTLARAVVARMWSARRFLMEELQRRQGRVAILNVASGACREYMGGFEPSHDREVTLTCVDNDSEALEFAGAQTAAVLNRSRITATFTRYNALRMTSASANVREFGRSDIIYSVGLCDYIPDEYLVPMLKGWRESLAPGGVVYVAFKDALLYDKVEYQWLMDWYFFQRTEDDFQRLFREAGYDLSQIESSRDSTGVIINYLCRTSGVAPVVRIDEAEQMPLTKHLDVVSSPSPASS
jgi:extracellular factor (EF) 3-hydroxypalmitic acid methyl ester biosynthesis protein